MRASLPANDTQDGFGEDDLRSIRAQLDTLARATTAYPLECSLAGYELLFESRDEIEALVDSFNDELHFSRESREAA